MRLALSGACWLCVIGLYALAPFQLPGEPRARRRAWMLLLAAIAFSFAAVVLERGSP